MHKQNEAIQNEITTRLESLKENLEEAKKNLKDRENDYKTAKKQVQMLTSVVNKMGGIKRTVTKKKTVSKPTPKPTTVTSTTGYNGNK